MTGWKTRKHSWTEDKRKGERNMAKRNIFRGLAAVLALGMCMTGLAGCGSEKRADGKTEIEVVSYKPEAVKAFEKIEKL